MSTTKTGIIKNKDVMIGALNRSRSGTDTIMFYILGGVLDKAESGYARVEILDLINKTIELFYAIGSDENIRVLKAAYKTIKELELPQEEVGA